MSEGPIITGTLRVKDETGPGLSSAGSNMMQFSNVATVAGGIIQAQFATNIVRALEDVGRTSVEQAAAFELATARIIAASGKTGEEAEALKKQIEETSMALGVEFGTGATRTMEALEALVKAGLDPATEAVAALEGVLQLATIESMNTALAANMVVQAMTQFSVSAEDATKVVDLFVQASAAGIDTASGYASGLSNVGATAAAMGISMEETLAALVQLDNTFGSAQSSGTFLNRMLLDMTGKAEAAGLELFNLDGSMKTLDEIMQQVRTVLQGFGDDQRAVNEWLGQFDTRAQKAILGLSGYDESISETQASLEGMAGANQQVNVILDTYTGKMSKAQAQQENNNIEIGETTTQLSLMGAEFTASLGPIGSVAAALGPSLLSGAMQGLTIAFMPALIAKIAGAGGLTAALGGVGAAITGGGGLIASIAAIASPLLIVIAAIAVFALAWRGNWFGIRDKTSAAVDAIKGTLKGLGESLRKSMSNIKSWASDVVSRAKNAWKKASDLLSRALKKEKKAKSAVASTSGTSSGGGADVMAQHGFEGMVTRPTTFLAGEAGPEFVSITPRGGGGRRIVINGPIIQIMGDASKETARLAAKQVLRELRKIT